MKEIDRSPNSGQHADEHEDAQHDGGNVQTLTDLLDKLDRAAFKRVLEHRDATRPTTPTAEVGNG